MLMETNQWLRFRSSSLYSDFLNEHLPPTSASGSGLGLLGATADRASSTPAPAGSGSIGSASVPRMLAASAAPLPSLRSPPREQPKRNKSRAVGPAPTFPTASQSDIALVAAALIGNPRDGRLMTYASAAAKLTGTAAAASHALTASSQPSLHERSPSQPPPAKSPHSHAQEQSAHHPHAQAQHYVQGSDIASIDSKLSVLSEESYASFHRHNRSDLDSHSDGVPPLSAEG